MTSFIGVSSETFGNCLARVHQVLYLEKQASPEGAPRMEEREIVHLEVPLPMSATASASPRASVAVVLEVGTML